MKAVYGHVRNVKAMSSTGDTIIEVVVPVEVHRTVVDLVFGRDVLVTLGPSGLMPGIVDSDKLEAVEAGGCAPVVYAKPALKLSQLAAVMCKEPDLWRYLRPVYPEQWTDADRENNARAWMLEVCGIESRSELDSNEVAAEHFRNAVRDPFVRWMRGDPPVVDKSGALV